MSVIYELSWEKNGKTNILIMDDVKHVLYAPGFLKGDGSVVVLNPCVFKGDLIELW